MPDMRFGQMLSYLKAQGKEFSSGSFYAEEAAWNKLLDFLIEKAEKKVYNDAL